MEIESNIDIVSNELESFTITRVEAKNPKWIALFAVGRGGNPSRHRHLLQTLANGNCTVIAPHFEMLTSIAPTKAELDMRIRRLEASIDDCTSSNLPIVGIGHSIGATAMLALQGAEGETLDGQQLIRGSTPRLERLAVLAPPTDFFRRPGALDRIKMPMKIWVGDKDTITPPAQSRFLMDVLTAQASVALQVDPDAGHFTYMDELPPNVPEPHPDRHTFLAGLADEVTAFLVG
ncbi:MULTISPECIES: alpha/beta hydrolase [Agrobacterium]|uniref:alpha/beta hydrolase n=1 Tax=Agrobacterium TaxID=357 RepID=UPI0003657F9E|nr:alpha/beta hydrolase [Agrobacterium sp. 10MFCol1.1]UXU08783.1 alpha/beta hydrolase [Agrobacterium tumefaciens]